MDADVFFYPFWVVALCVVTQSYNLHFCKKSLLDDGAAFKTCPDFFLVPFEVVEKLSKWSHALSKTSPKQFGRRPEWKIQFQSCRICRHFEELAKLSASRKTFIQAKKKKVCFKALRLQQFDWSKQFISIDYVFHFIFSKGFVVFYGGNICFMI